MKKKTHAEYVAELAENNPDIEVLGIYCGANVKIPHRCKIDGTVWNATPSNILRGTGCPCCGKIKYSNSRRKTHEEYVEELSQINSNINVLEKYINAKTPILHLCNIHNYEWKISPSNALCGCGCPLCRGEKIHNAFIKSHEQYIEELRMINPNIKVLEKYNGAQTPILHKCLIDGYEWSPVPESILQGSGCPKCGHIKTGNSSKITNEEYVARLREINPNIIALEEYINAQTPILHKCLIDGYEWHIRPKNTLNAVGCPKCRESKGERKIRLWLDEHCVLYETQMKFENCCDIQPLPFDFCISSLNTVIEYDGRHHYEPVDIFGGQEQFEIQQKHDKIKNEYCKNNGISILRIPYYKYDSIEEELNNFLS